MSQDLEYIVYILVLGFLLLNLKYDLFNNDVRLTLSLFAILHGFSIIILGSYLSLVFGLSIFFVGLYGLNRFLPLGSSGNKVDCFSIPEKFVNLFNVIGIIGIFTTVYFNKFIVNNDFGSNDYVSFLLCFILILYRKFDSINSSFTNISFLSILFLFLILVFPRLIVLYLKDDLYASFDRTIVYNFLNLPLQKLLSILDYRASSDLSTLKFYDINGDMQAVDIARNCSGLQSVALFISIFASYIVVVKRKIGFEALLFVLFGIFLSYIANLLRMLIIVLVGIHYTVEDMLWVHQYLGWLIFTLWFFIFWECYSFFDKTGAKL